MIVYHKNGDLYKHISNYIVVMNNDVFAVTKVDDSDRNITVKVGLLSQDKNFIITNNNIIPLENLTKDMDLLEDKDIPEIIKKRFGKWMH